jgi:hypothetical protein
VGSSSSTRWNGHVRHRTELDACAIGTALLKPMLREWLETSGRYEARSSHRIILGARIMAGRVTRDEFGALTRTLTIDYDIRPEWKDRIRLTPVSGRFGGLVWFLCCPTCDRRVRTLYVPLGPVLPELARPARCRACCGLRYYTQRCGPERRADLMVLRAAQRIDSRVRRVDEALDGPPEKPKRMRWARYDQLSAQYAEACEARDYVYLRCMPRALWRAMTCAACASSRSNERRRRAARPPATGQH